jgi:outer membrane lipoprotein-sorting protein
MRPQRLWAFVLACVILGVLGAGGATADLFDEIYARGKPLEAALKTLTASFTETSHSPLLARPLVARGTVAVIRPSRIAMHYSVPDSRTVIIDGGKLRVVWPAHGIDRTTAIGSLEKRLHQYFVDTSPKQLRSHFEIDARVADDRARTWFVTMNAKRKQIREGVSRLDLWIEQDRVMLSAMRLHFATGDVKLFEFDDVTLNPTIDEAVFSPRKD